MKDCPCGLNFPFTDCCGPLIRGVSYADTAEDLMRSRFTAYVEKNWNYLIQTTCADERAGKSAEALAESNQDTEWLRLEIMGSEQGGVEDQEGEVSFAAYYQDAEGEKVLRETSKFFREDGRWRYSENESTVHPQKVASAAGPAKPFVREGTKVGRNDPCPCGSGKKYKKCCGR